MTDFAAAIAARMEAARLAKEPPAFSPDPELERLAERMDILRETSPKEYADADFGGIRQRVETYRARKANHERNSQ